MQVRFISDLHFGHENMAIKRGFSCADEMNRHIIKMWNETVTSHKDITYILGDLTMESDKFYPLIGELRGVKHVVLGNHDRKQDLPYLLQWVNSAAGMINYKKKVILTHAPIHPCELDYRFKFNVHGHVHENTLPDTRYVNVSAEAIGYVPRRLEELGIEIKNI